MSLMDLGISAYLTHKPLQAFEPELDILFLELVDIERYLLDSVFQPLDPGMERSVSSAIETAFCDS